MNSINIIPTRGLCNRLRVVFSYLDFAQQQNIPLNVYWKVDWACPGNFLDVFDPVENLLFLENKPTIVTYEGCYPKVTMNKYLYKNLKPNNNILNRLSIFSNYNNYNAIHIRRTDHITLAKKKLQFTSEEIFKNFIEQSNKKVYLACDDINTQKQFLDKYPEKIFVNKIIQSTKNIRQTSLRDAVIDLFMCVKSDQFIGTAYSSYSDLIKLLRS